MSKRRRQVFIYDWTTKPVTLNTKSRWQTLGYRPRRGVTPCASLYNKYKKNCDLFNKHQVEMIPGAAAAQRRADLRWSIARGQMRKLAEDWLKLFVNHRPPTDDEIQDAGIGYSECEFLDWWDMPCELNQTRRDMLRFEFEKGICRLQGRDYADYAYCETF